MGYTASEKMLQRASGQKAVRAGDTVEADPDFIMLWDIQNYSKMFEEFGIKRIYDPEKIGLFLGHHQFLPATDERAIETNRDRDFAKRYGFKYVYEFGTGICHYLMPEQGHVSPGAVVVGGDSHTTAYGGVGSYSNAISGEHLIIMMTGRTWFKIPETIKININGKLKPGTTIRDVCQHAIKEVPPEECAGFTTLEWAGPVVEKTTIQERWILGSWAYEMGAGASYITPNDEVLKYCEARAKKPFKAVFNDPDANYTKEYTLDVSELGPQVAVPYHPGNTKNIEEVAGTEIQQAYVGGCTGGNIESLRQAAKVLKGKQVYPSVRTIIVPGTLEIERQALREGLYEIFYTAGAMCLPPYCGPCQMHCVGNLANEPEPETMIGTNPRNYAGRSATGTKVYLASPYTVIASAITGRITDPRTILEDT